MDQKSYDAATLYELTETDVAVCPAFCNFAAISRFDLSTSGSAEIHFGGEKKVHAIVSIVRNWADISV